MKRFAFPQQVTFSFTDAGWLYLMLVPSVAGLWFLTPTRVLVAALLTFAAICLGHSVTLHRGVIHQSFRAPRWATRLGLFLFVLAGMGGPLTWIRLHHVRDYWQNHPRCPPYFSYNHSIGTELWWSLHSKYQPKRVEEMVDLRTIADAQWLRFLEWSWPLHNLLLGGLLFLFGGWGMVLVAGCLRITVSIVGHYAIKGSPEQGRNIWLLGVISFGEGFHNNHHAYPASARMGQFWYEFDIGWYVLRCLEACGVVWNLQAFGRTNSGIKSAVQPTP